MFPSDDSFWGQFSERDARGLAASLASLGFRFDGLDGWVDGRAPQARDLANALSYCGFDPRSLRRPSGPADMDTLWHGTRLTAQEFLLANAPELTLPELTSLLGPASGHLAELWDVWGRLRPLLVGAGSQPMSM